MVKTILAFTALFFLAACSGLNIPLAINTPVVSPSSAPAILSPTPPFIPSATPTTTALSSTVTFTEVPSTTPTTATATSTLPITATSASTLPAAPTSTFTPTPVLLLDILGCNTSLDLTHQMGEVTNVYPIIRNRTESDLTNVCATLTASDEARLHPDKTSCIASLPNGYQVTLKLTVDTGFKQDTSIQVDTTSNEGFTASVTRSSCRDIGLPGWVPGKIGVVEPIP